MLRHWNGSRRKVCWRTGGCNCGSVSEGRSTATVTGKSYVGGLVGYNSKASIASSCSSGAVSGDSEVGGLVGYNDQGSIATSGSTGPVSGDSTVGGLLGFNWDGHVSQCCSTGAVTGMSGSVALWAGTPTGLAPSPQATVQGASQEGTTWAVSSARAGLGA